MNHIKRWLAAPDPDLVIIAVITLISLLLRWYLALGAVLGDDGSYASLAKAILQGNYPRIDVIGQYEYRPAWLLPIAASIWLLGWTARGLVLYPVVTGAFLPLLTALWLRRHLPRGSPAPVLCAFIVACYPTLFVDSLMLVNEIPLIFWCLLCVNLFGRAYWQLTDTSAAVHRWWSWIGFSFLAGATFATAYQVKATAIPMLGFWLSTELVLQMIRRGRPGRKRWLAIVLASVVFVAPSLGVQLFYKAKTGHILGNITGEMRLYEQWLSGSYYRGELRVGSILREYVEQLFLPVGPDGFQVYLHGAWIFVALGLGLAAGVFWRRLHAPERTLAMAFLTCSVGLFLFLEFWPAKIRPYYLPNCFSGRSPRYVEVLAPSIAACVAVILAMPGIYDRWVLRALRHGLLGACFGIAGYCLVVRFHQYADSIADYRQAAAACATSLKAYFELPQILDVDGCGQFTATLGWPDRSPLRSSPTRFLDLRNSPPVCIWTGGARREGIDADASWSPDRLSILGGDAVLIHTFAGLRRPWRPRVLQMWLFRPTKVDAHDLEPRP